METLALIVACLNLVMGTIMFVMNEKRMGLLNLLMCFLILVVLYA